MLPFALSENVCSLYQKEDRIAFVLDITVQHAQDVPAMQVPAMQVSAMQVKKISFTSALVRVEKNYAYDAAELLGRDDYKGMLAIVRKLNNENAVRYLPAILNSHDLVEYCMLFMNRECAKSLQAKKTGIFRSATRKTALTFEPELQELLQNVAGEYCSYENLKPHELIGCESYLHITSPIRRLVDIVNMLEIQAALIPWSPAAQTFISKWKTAASLAQINKKTKAARKLQNEIEVLEAYQKNPERIYMGVVFNKIPISVSLYKYSVYIPETKVLTTVKCPNIVGTGTSTVYLSAHLFLDEAKMTKKIRLQFL
jgi:exoribonuclease R